MTYYLSITFLVKILLAVARGGYPGGLPRGNTPYDGLREAPPERDTFFRLLVSKTVWIS